MDTILYSVWTTDKIWQRILTPVTGDYPRIIIEEVRWDPVLKNSYVKVGLSWIISKSLENKERPIIIKRSEYVSSGLMRNLSSAPPIEGLSWNQTKPKSYFPPPRRKIIPITKGRIIKPEPKPLVIESEI
jgi:hypothetical protein